MTPQERLLQGFIELITIDSPTRGEEKIAALLRTKLQELGFDDISEDNAATAIGGTTNNMFGYLAGTAPLADTLPTIMLSAHMDCVPPCHGIEPQIIDGIITSKGDTILGGDDKSGVIAILEGLRRLKEENVPLCNIQIIFTVAEESGVNGSRNMDKSKIKADFGYVLDSGGAPGTIINAAPGINKFTVKITGKAAHAGLAPETGVNAIVVAAKALQKFPQGRKDHETTANVGTISGGNATNIVADYAEVVCEARSLQATSLEAITKDIVSAFESTAAENNAQIHIDIHNSYGSFKLEPTMPAIVLAKEAAENLGLPVSIHATGGGSDANNFNTYGVPTVPLGTGMSKVHTTEEFISVEHLEQCCQWVVAILKRASV